MAGKNENFDDPFVKIEFFVSPFEIFHCMIDNKIEKDHGESVCLVIEKNEGEGTWRKVV
jgi:hypothetical protein